MSRGLGRGFGSLIPTEDLGDDFESSNSESSSQMREIDVDQITADPNQPRRKFDQAELSALSLSIQALGVIEPLVVKKVGRKYQIIAGERRWRAARMAELKAVPCVIRTADDKETLLASLAENLQREDLNAIEVANSYARMRDEFGLGPTEIGKMVGHSKGKVSNTLRLLQLPDFAKKAIIDYNLKEGVMKPLISASEEEIREVLPYIINEQWSARKVEQYMVTLRARREKQEEADKDEANDPRIIESEQRAENIASKLGVRVKVHASSKGSGSITLKFKDEREFERLCTILTT